MDRGEIWWANLPTPKGSEPGYRRPVLIIQSDDFTRTRIKTVIVAVITSNLRLGQAPGNISLTARTGGLPRDSVVNVSQLMTLDKTFLTERVHTLPARVMTQVDAGVRLVLSL